MANITIYLFYMLEVRYFTEKRGVPLNQMQLFTGSTVFSCMVSKESVKHFYRIYISAVTKCEISFSKQGGVVIPSLMHANGFGE